MPPLRPLAVPALLLVALLGCQESGPPPARGPESPPVPVRVETTRMESRPTIVEVMGTVRARASAVIASRVQGYVVEVAVREGDRVRAGDLLLRLDEAEAAAQLARAEAAHRASVEAAEEARRGVAAAAADEAEAAAGVTEVRSGLEALARAVDEAEALRAGAASREGLAATTLERYRRMHEERALSPQEYDEVLAREQATRAELQRADAALGGARAALVQQQARLARAGRAVEAVRARREAAESRVAVAGARMEEATAEIRRARVQLGYHRIIAPVDGLLVGRSVEVGDLAIPGRPLLRLDDASVYRLEVPLASEWAAAVRPGQVVPVVVDTLEPRPLEGRVVEVLPEADPATRTVTVKVELPPIAGARSGQAGRARFETGRSDVLRVPAAAVVQRGQLTGLYVVQGEDVARFRLVTLGQRIGGHVEVLSGLRAGEPVVVTGADGLVDGARVRVGP